MTYETTKLAKQTAEKLEDDIRACVVKNMTKTIRKAIERTVKSILVEHGITEARFTDCNNIGWYGTVPKLDLRIESQSDIKDRLEEAVIPFLDSILIGCADLNFTYKDGVFTWGKWL